MPNCDTFAGHFTSKIQLIRSALRQSQPSNVCIIDPTFSSSTLENFALVDAKSRNKVILQFKLATCFLDPIPTSLFKSIYKLLDRDYYCIVNCKF